MSVAIVGTPATPAPFTSGTGTSYTAGAGSSRVVVLVLEHSSSAGGGTPNYTGVQPTFGGVNMTQVGSFITSSSVRYMCVSIWLLKEASIPAGANTLVASWNNATNNLNEANALATIYTLSGVDQTTPVTSTGSGNANGVTTLASSSVTSTTGGMVLYGVSFNASTGTGVTLPSGYTTDDTVTPFDFSGFAAGGHKAIVSGGTEAPSVSWTGSGGAAIIAANFQAVSSAFTLSVANLSYAYTLQAQSLIGPNPNALNVAPITYSYALQNEVMNVTMPVSALVYSLTLVNQTLSTTSDYVVFAAPLSYAYSIGTNGSDIQMDAAAIVYAYALQNASLQTPLPVITCAGGTFDSLVPMPGLML